MSKNRLIEVRIRADFQPVAIHFCKWDLLRIEELIAALKQGGGVFTDDNDACEDVSFQYVVSDGSAYCELVVNASDSGGG